MSKIDNFNQGTIASMLYQRAHLMPNDIAYNFPQYNQSYNWAQIVTGVEPIAKNLIGLGVQKGDRVAILMEGRVEFILTLYAAAIIGAVSVPINTYSKKNELKSYLKDAGAKVLVMTSNGQHINYLQLLHEIITEVKNTEEDKLWLPLHVFVVDDDEIAHSFKNYSDLCNTLNDISDNSYHDLCSKVRSDDPVLLLHTSGTTGIPKGILRSTASYLVSKKGKNQQPGYVKRCVTLFFDKLSNRFKVLVLMPLYHQGGVSLLFTTLSESNVQLVILPHFNPVKAINAIEKTKSHFIIATPFMVQTLMNVLPTGSDILNTIKGIAFSGAAVNYSMIERTKDKFKKLAFLMVSYGSSETGGIANGTCVFTEHNDLYISVLIKFLTITNLLNGIIPFEEFGKTPFSIGGRVDKVVDVKIRNTTTGKFLSVGEEGEIVVRSHRVMPYMDEMTLKKSFLDGGWFRTGDLGYLTNDGLIVISGRMKRQISRGGEKISPAEIEHAILENKNIADVFVLGIEDDLYGEQVCAAVITNDNKNIDFGQLKEQLKDRLSNFKLPKYFVQLSNFPMSSMGKVATDDIKKLVLEKIKNDDYYA